MMATLGFRNTLKVLGRSPQGLRLDGGPLGELRLSLEERPEDKELPQCLEVFVYLNERGRPAATTRMPLAQRGEVAFLQVSKVGKDGAYLKWGLPQELFLPWPEVKRALRPKLRAGQKVLVILFAEEDGHLLASTRLEEFLSDEAEGFQEGERVSLVIGEPTDLGVRVVVNHRCWGLIHRSDIFGPLPQGESREGYLKALRADHRLDVALSAPGYGKVDALAQQVLDVLARHGGFLPVSDGSAPEDIYRLFGISKKVFKQALGALYKARRITLEANGIRVAKLT